MEFQLQSHLARIILILNDGSTIIVRYNDHNQYSYSLIYSNIKYDRVRFDNYDDRWPVKTKPHHFHAINGKEAFASPMIGDPIHDLAIFIKLIRLNVLRDSKYRFEV